MRGRLPVLPWLCASLVVTGGHGCHEKIAVSSPIDGGAASAAHDGATVTSVQAASSDGGVAAAGAPDLGPFHALGGRISDLAGFAVAGATVRAGSATAKSDAEGAYSLSVSARASHLDVEAPGYRAARVAFGLGDALARADVLLVAVGTIGGAVSDERGRGVAGAHVVLAGSAVWPARRTTTDRAGRFSFDDVAEGVYELVAVKEGAPPLTTPLASARIYGVAVEGPGGAATADLHVVRAGHVVGRVAGLDGRVVAGARVTLSEERLAVLGDDSFTDRAGTFRSGHVAPGRYVVRVAAPGLPELPPAELLVSAGETTFHVTMPRGATLRGRVVDASGEGVAGARLVAHVEGSAGPRTLAVQSSRKRTQLANVREKAFAGVGGKSGARPDEAAAAAASGDAITDKEGRFTLRAVPAGSVRVLAFHVAHGPARSAALLVHDGDTRDITLRLTAAASLEGRVVDELGASMDGARVVLRDPHDV